MYPILEQKISNYFLLKNWKQGHFVAGGRKRILIGALNAISNAYFDYKKRSVQITRKYIRK